MINDHLFMIAGESATGKSASLRNFAKLGSRVIYLNSENGKRLPFRNEFSTLNLSNPYIVFDAFREADPTRFDLIIIDSLTFLMELFESQVVLRSDNTMKAWSDYQQFFKELMQEYVASCPLPVIFTAHTKTDIDDNGIKQTSVPVKGALKNNGIEAYFSTVVSAEKVSIKDLKDYGNSMLNITPQEEALGFKYCFQTQPTRKTTDKRIRAPMGLFTVEETFIDNDAQLLLDHIRKFYS